MAGHNNWPYIINLGNSIIGVAVLAMPFCFKQCGIILAMLVLLFCTWLTLASCQLLMKAGIASRRRSYEFLAYHTHGATGKFLSEVGMIGMQVGTLIAQIVVIGDLGPAIISKLFGLENTSNLRTWLIMMLCLCVGLPLGLLKDLRNVSRASTVCISFYTVFIIYVVFLSLPNLWTGSWYPHVRFWRVEGLFQCLPILSFSFGCQTQLFLLYDALPEPSFKSISSVISSAVNLCAVAYLVVGFFGYVTFYSFDVPGDILSIFPSTLFADMMKLCFVFSIVITFPVIIFPCRASIYTLLFSKRTKVHDDNIEGDVFMSENLFKGITITIVLGSMITGILIPNVEFILGINGAIVGTLICYIFPALFFLKVMGTKTEGKVIAQMVFVLGISIMLLSSYATLSSQDQGHSHIESPKDVIQPDQPLKGMDQINDALMKPPDDPLENANKRLELNGDTVKKKEVNEKVEDKRQEPPNPDPPDSIQVDVKKKKNSSVLKAPMSNQEIDKLKVNDEKVEKRDESVVKEEKLEEKVKKQDELIHQLEVHREEQEKLLKEQRQVLKELKDHQEEDHKEELEETLLKKDAVDPLQNEIVNKQQQIINEQQKVIEQQQEQLKQQKKIDKPNDQQPPEANQQQPVVNQQPPQVNQQPQVHQQQLLVNQQQPLANQQQPVVNQQQPIVNQKQQIVNVPQPVVNQQQPVVNQQQQQKPVVNQQQQPIINQQQQQQSIINQQKPLVNQQQQQQPIIKQQQPLVNQQEEQPHMVNQQQPLVNQQQQLQPVINQQPLVNQQQAVLNQQQPLVNQQQPGENQNQPKVNQEAQINQNDKRGIENNLQKVDQLDNSNQKLQEPQHPKLQEIEDEI